MPHRKPIQLIIENPCSQNWDEMNIADKGRFCDSCQKHVIDFTKWSDGELHRFFSQNNEHVCGRFYSYQLNRDIQIPPQPHSRLYRMAVALGLTIIVAQAPSYARKNPPLILQAAYDEPTTDSTNNAKCISGRVTDKTGMPLPALNVRLMKNGAVVTVTKTDLDGRYFITFESDTATDYVLDVKAPGHTKRFFPVKMNGNTLVMNLEIKDFNYYPSYPFAEAFSSFNQPHNPIVVLGGPISPQYHFPEWEHPQKPTTTIPDVDLSTPKLSVKQPGTIDSLRKM